jgi:D-alanyl-D-alanine carboxypeptidase/D-alanyl-D-alanine-endopeptidase (penicillin-binding protein 4)
MLESSSNYVANQVSSQSVAGAGAPASLSKSIAAADRFLAAHPELAGIHVVEGSGISYENRGTGRAMAALLAMFEANAHLLKSAHGTRHKTGTLRIVATVVGYLQTSRHGTVRYVIALNGNGHEKRWKIVQMLEPGCKTRGLETSETARP